MEAYEYMALIGLVVSINCTIYMYFLGSDYMVPVQFVSLFVRFKNSLLLLQQLSPLHQNNELFL